MATTHNELMKRVEAETGYNSRIVTTICEQFVKEIIKELVYGNHEIVITKFMNLKLKNSYASGEVRGGFIKVSPNARRMVATFTETVRRRLPEEGIEAVMKDLWGV